MTEERRRKHRNCDGITNKTLYVEGYGVGKPCPWSIDDLAWELFRAWSDWKAFNILPFGSNNLLDEPAYVIEAFRVCEEARSKAEREALEKAKRKRK